MKLGWVLVVVSLAVGNAACALAQEPPGESAPIISVISEQESPSTESPRIDDIPGEPLLPGGPDGALSERRSANRILREEIRSMDILERPYRNVFHVYGNAVRRRHSRGAMPIRNLWAQPQ
jgi:hypothetical protein